MSGPDNPFLVVRRKKCWFCRIFPLIKLKKSGKEETGLIMRFIKLFLKEGK